MDEINSIKPHLPQTLLKLIKKHEKEITKDLCKDIAKVINGTMSNEMLTKKYGIEIIRKDNN